MQRVKNYFKNKFINKKMDTEKLEEPVIIPDIMKVKLFTIFKTYKEGKGQQLVTKSKKNQTS